MKDYLQRIINKNSSAQNNLNKIREYLQENFLYILYKKKFYTDLVFCGGTALRFLYKLKRFSEDLDFSLSIHAKNFDFLSLLKTVKNELIASGYNVEIKYSSAKNVNNAFLRFPKLLFEYNLSPHKEEKLSIKVEIDTNPPAGGQEEVSVYNGSYMFYLNHYNLESLFAGKIHALLSRKYTKGRDWYDLLWYRTKFKELEPNFVLLNAALEQTHPKHPEINKNNWKKEIIKVVENLDVKKIKNDVYRFLETPEEQELLTKESFFTILIEN
ncbi:MAG: nucleotidyl transferase AbiEii/AbiGii toxin family protein [Elusimicrobiota bacterium]